MITLCDTAPRENVINTSVAWLNTPHFETRLLSPHRLPVGWSNDCDYVSGTAIKVGLRP